jgi:hypothetical protein
LLSELQDITKQLEKMLPVDNVLWMNVATFESLMEQLDVKLVKPPRPDREYFTLTDLSAVTIYLDEALAPRIVESGTYEKGRFGVSKKIVRHRYTIGPATIVNPEGCTI